MFELKSTHNPHRWYLPVEPALCVGPLGKQFLFGGAGLAASIKAMEQTAGRPVMWATAHYLSFARPGQTVDLDVWLPVVGRLTTQASVLMHIEDRKIISVQAALGERDEEGSDQWVAMPVVAPPEDCEEVSHWRGDGSGLNSRLEIRLAQGQFHGGTTIGKRGDGRLIFWLRSREGHAVDACMLALAADHVASGIAGATGQHAGGNSLDNTIRYGRIIPCEWILCDIQIDMMLNGIVHGRMNLFSPDGVLMATASQSMIKRVRPAPE